MFSAYLVFMEIQEPYKIVIKQNVFCKFDFHKYHQANQNPLRPLKDSSKTPQEPLQHLSGTIFYNFLYEKTYFCDRIPKKTKKRKVIWLVWANGMVKFDVTGLNLYSFESCVDWNGSLALQMQLINEKSKKRYPTCASEGSAAGVSQ